MTAECKNKCRLPVICREGGVLALEIVDHSISHTELSRSEALKRAQRVLVTDGLAGVLRGAPEDLQQRVIDFGRPEVLFIVVLSVYNSSSSRAA